MRIILVLISFQLFFIANLIYSQEKQLSGFGELDWKSSREAVKDLMKDKYALLPGYEKDDAIGYQDGRYFNQDLFMWVYFFDKQGLHEVDLVVKNINRMMAGLFSEVVHSLTEEYGDPDLYKPDDWTAEWYYYDIPKKQLNATIKVSPYSNDRMTTIKITFLDTRKPKDIGK